MTSKPFGVNMTVFPTIHAPDYKAYAKAIIDGGVMIVETAGTASVAEIWEMLKPHGITIVHKCTSVRHSLSAERKGVDVISIDGFECAGHPGEDDLPGLILIPCATQEAPIHRVVKQAYVDNDERGSLLIFRRLKNTARVGRSVVTEEAARRLTLPDAKFEDVAELVSGRKGRELLQSGDLSQGVFWAGMIQGLIHEIREPYQ